MKRTKYASRNIREGYLLIAPLLAGALLFYAAPFLLVLRNSVFRGISHSEQFVGLQNFRDIPAKKAVMALDGKTDIHLAKEIVGDTMCIMGDVPAAMLAFSKPQDVYDYTMNLIKTVGPTGYMVCSGCDIPFNGKVENMQMMAKAADDAAKK